MATHSSILAWRIPWPEEPGRLRLMGLQRVGHDWVTKQACSNYENFHVELSHPRAGKGTECGGWDSFQSALQEHKQDLICLRNKDLWHYLCSMSWSCSYRQNCKITCTCTSCTWSHWSFTASCKAVVLITVWEGRIFKSSSLVHSVSKMLRCCQGLEKEGMFMAVVQKPESFGLKIGELK